MKLFLLILGVIFIGLGGFLTFQGWTAASRGQMEPTVYVGPFLIVMGLFRLFRAMSAMPRSIVLRYVALGIAVATGWGDQALARQFYPNAVTVPLTPPQH